MFRPLRLIGGWSLALAAALLLNLALPRPTSAPSGVALSREEASPSPSPSAFPSAAPSEPLPPVDPPPDGEAGSGSGRTAELAPLGAFQAAALQAATDRARVAFGLDALAIGISINASAGWTGASGLAVDGVTPLDGSSPFAIASITKTFTAAVVLELADEGRLSLHDEVAKLLPDVAVPAGVRVYHLLRHTSGIMDLLAPLRDQLNADTERRWQPAEVVAGVGRPWFSPGTAWAYSNTNYVLLGMIVERVTHRPLSRLVRERLLAPLELSGTGMLLQKSAPFLMAPSWASAFGASGNMYSTPHDLLRWGDALYGHQVLSRAGLRRMLDFQRHGYGMGAERLKVGGRAGYGHSGLLRGFTSLLIHLPDSGITMVVMGTSNRFDPALVLSHREPGQPSIADLARRAARLQVAIQKEAA